MYKIVFKVCPNYFVGGKYECCFSHDSKIALVTEKGHIPLLQMCQLVDLDACKEGSLTLYFG